MQIVIPTATKHELKPRWLNARLGIVDNQEQQKKEKRKEKKRAHCPRTIWREGQLLVNDIVVVIRRKDIKFSSSLFSSLLLSPLSLSLCLSVSSTYFGKGGRGPDGGGPGQGGYCEDRTEGILTGFGWDIISQWCGLWWWIERDFRLVREEETMKGRI
jgi:hypothetical protein